MIYQSVLDDREHEPNVSALCGVVLYGLFFKHPIRTVLTSVIILQLVLFFFSFTKLSTQQFYYTTDDISVATSTDLEQPDSVTSGLAELGGNAGQIGTSVAFDGNGVGLFTSDIRQSDVVQEGEASHKSLSLETIEQDILVEDTIPPAALSLAEKLRSIRDFPELTSQYYTLDELYSFIYNLTDSTVQYNASQQQDAIQYTEGELVITLEKIGESIEKRPLYCIRLQSKRSRIPEDKRKGILILSGVHAREWSSIASVIHIIYKIKLSYNRVSFVRNLFNDVILHFIPVVNPDGYVYSWSTDGRKRKNGENDMEMFRQGTHADPRGGNKFRPLAPKSRHWRDNRRDNLQGSHGVDLNRNFGTEGSTWGSGAKNRNFIDYQGESPFSEPESQAVLNYAKGRSDITAFLDFHCCSKDVRAPGASIKEAYSEEMLSDIQRVGKALVGGMTDVHGTKHKYTLHTASTPGLGITSSWAHWDMGWKYSYVVELGGGFITRATWLQNKTDEALSAIVLTAVEITTTDQSSNQHKQLFKEEIQRLRSP